MGIIEKIRGFFKREEVYNIYVNYQTEQKPPDKTFKSLDYHLPLEVEFGNRLMKVER